MSDYQVYDALTNKDRRPKKDGWAEGNYTAKCIDCKVWFVGDKRAVQCAPCAYDDKGKD